MTEAEFKPEFKRVMRQLDERRRKVILGQKPERYYENKRREFKALIDEVIKAGWFELKTGTRIYNIYYGT
jgi:hypothetical protein